MNKNASNQVILNKITVFLAEEGYEPPYIELDVYPEELTVLCNSKFFNYDGVKYKINYFEFNYSIKEGVGHSVTLNVTKVD